MSLTEKNIKLLKALSYASAMFSLMVAITMIFSFLQLNFVRPLESPVLTELKKSYDANPQNADLKEQIRAIDLMARKAYFSSRWQIETGSYLLVFGALFFFISQRIITDNEKKQPSFLGSSPILGNKKEVRKYLFSASFIVIILAIVISFYLRNELPNPIAVEKEVLTEGVSKTIEITTPVPQKKIVQKESIPETVVAEPQIDESKSVAVKKVVVEEITKGENKTDDVNYPFFRGNNSQGKVSSGNYPTLWDGKAGKNILWKTEISIEGFNSPIIWGDKLFLTGADYNDAAIYCLDKKTGKMLWTASGKNVEGEPAQAPETSADTGLGAPTAATNGEEVVVIFATGNFLCFDMDGSQLWAKNIGVPDNHYGHSSSLIIHENKVLVQYDHHISKSIMAFNIKTGEMLWVTARTVALSWASPVLATFDGITQVILSSDPAVISYDVKTGEELWSVNCMSAEVGPSVGINSKYVFAANEFAKLVAIKPGKDAAIVWADNEYLPEVASPLATEECLFVATSYGAIACYAAESGEILWNHDFDYGFYSSPILVGDKVYLTDQIGVTHIFKADKEFVLISEPPLGESVNTTPAFSEGKIYIRGEKYLYCIGE